MVHTFCPNKAPPHSQHTHRHTHTQNNSPLSHITATPRRTKFLPFSLWIRVKSGKVQTPFFLLRRSIYSSETTQVLACARVHRCPPHSSEPTRIMYRAGGAIRSEWSERATHNQPTENTHNNVTFSTKVAQCARRFTCLAYTHNTQKGISPIWGAGLQRKIKPTLTWLSNQRVGHLLIYCWRMQ